jgi:prepilin-type N-terminal cleavage/methylation domain-containing protein
MTSYVFKNQRGMSLVEVMIVLGITATSIVASMTFFTNQTRSTNFLEFQGKREQLRVALLGQFLNDANNCRCLFNGALPFPISGTPDLMPVGGAVAPPTVIGRFGFVTPGDCATATVPVPLVSTAGVDFLRLNSVGLRNILPIGGVYSGEFFVSVSSTKSVAGPAELPIRVPVNVLTSTVAGQQVFQGCTVQGAGAGTGGLDFSDFLDNGISWTALTLSNSGGAGASSGANGSPVLDLSSVGDFVCGPVATVTLNNPSVTATTRAAWIGFANMEDVEQSSLARIFTLDNRLVGAVGQAGRGGDGRSYGAGGEILVPLDGRRFRIQFCRRGGGSSTFYYSVKAALH